MNKRLIALFMAAALFTGSIVSVSAAESGGGSASGQGSVSRIEEQALADESVSESESAGAVIESSEEETAVSQTAGSAAADEGVSASSSEVESDSESVAEPVAESVFESSEEEEAVSDYVAGEADSQTAADSQTVADEDPAFDSTTEKEGISDSDISADVPDEDVTADGSVEDVTVDGTFEDVTAEGTDEDVSDEDVTAEGTVENDTADGTVDDVTADGSVETLEGEDAVNESSVASGEIGASRASDVTWKLTGSSSDGYTLYIEGSGNMAGFVNKNVPWSSYSADIVKVVVGEGVKNLGHYVFQKHEKLATVSLPSTLTYIGANVFFDCAALTSITIPAGVTYIGSSAFQDCSSLKSIQIPEGLERIGSGTLFMGCSSLKSISLPAQIVNDDATKEYSFGGCSSLTTLTVPDEALSVDLADCIKLTTLNLGDQVEVLELSGCVSLKKLVAPENLKWLRMYECTGIQEVTLPESMTVLNDDIFNGCTKLEKVTLGSRVTEIGERAFNECSSLNTLNVPETVTIFGECAFMNCGSLPGFTFGSNLQSIGKGAFSGCTKFETVNIPEGMTELADKAFSDCTGVTSISLPSTLKKINDYSFCNCPGLKSVTIPDSVKTIGDSAFSSCTGLTKLTIPEGVETISDYAFEACNDLARINIMGVVNSIGTSAFDTYGESDSLRYVFFYGSESQWAKYGIDYLPAAAKIYYITKPVTNMTAEAGIGMVNGGTASYSPDFTPSNASCQEYSYKIEDSSIVSFNKNTGTLTGKKPGLTTITAISYDGAFRATTKVRVYPSIADTEVTGIEEKTYTGSSLEQDITVTDTSYNKGYVLQENTDYTVTYKDNIEPGTATVTLKGIGNYRGGKKFTFTINGISIEGAKVTGIVTKTYNGKEQTQSPTVTLSGTTLKSGTDYTLSYKNNKYAGTATVTITGKGNYTGSISNNFTINKAKQNIKVTVRKSITTITVGRKTCISVVGCMGARTFESSNTAVATVSSKGEVTGKKAGRVTITVTCASKTNYLAATGSVTIDVVPHATTKITTTNLERGIKVTWKTVEGAAGYLLYRNGTKIADLSGIKKVTYTDKKANTNGATYEYKVVARTAYVSSTYSRSVKAYRLSAPTWKTLKNSVSMKMTATWYINDKVSGYEIQYSTDKEFRTSTKTIKVKYNYANSKKIDKLTKGKTYYVRIRGYKGSVLSVWSAVKSVKITK